MNAEVVDVTRSKKIVWPVCAGLVGSTALALRYFGIVSWAESPSHALELFWDDRFIVLPIILGFGVQVALYVILKKRLFLPVANTGPSGALTGASGGMSNVATVACCGHHGSGVLSFPVTAEDGDLLTGASSLTLLLRDVDAAERTFTWNLD